VKAQATAIDARAAPSTSAPIPMDTSGDANAATPDHGAEVIMIDDGDDESTTYGSVASLGTTSVVSTTTQGESSVTWCSVAAQQVYDPADVSGTVVHNSGSTASMGKVETNFQTKQQSSLAKLHAKAKQAKAAELQRRQQSSLASAAVRPPMLGPPKYMPHRGLRVDGTGNESAEFRPFCPQVSVLDQQPSQTTLVGAEEAPGAAQVTATKTECPIVTAERRHAASLRSQQDAVDSAEILKRLVSLQDENALLMQMVLRLQNENDSAKEKEAARVKALESALVPVAATAGVANPVLRLNPVIKDGSSSLARLLQQQTAAAAATMGRPIVPNVPIGAIDPAPGYDDEAERQLVVVRTPPRRNSRNPRKTPHEYEFVEVQRTPPRTPDGQPKFAKKTRTIAPPAANDNRFQVLGESSADDEEMVDTESVDASTDMELSVAAVDSVVEVKEKLAETYLQNPPSGPDSAKSAGAGLRK
jgi:hypothetical protein